MLIGVTLIFKVTEKEKQAPYTVTSFSKANLILNDYLTHILLFFKKNCSCSDHCMKNEVFH